MTSNTQRDCVIIQMNKDKKETAACLAVNANSRKYSLV